MAGDGMVRFLTILALTLFIGQVLGIAGLIEEDDCIQMCPGDDANGDCPLGCQSCACCPSTRSMLATKVSGALPSLTGGFVRTESSRFPPAPEPREILHVPKLLLG